MIKSKGEIGSLSVEVTNDFDNDIHVIKGEGIELRFDSRHYYKWQQENSYRPDWYEVI